MSISRARIRYFSSDLLDAWKNRSAWTMTSHQLVQGSYRRTVIGPFWVSLQQIAFVIGLGAVYSQVFKIDSQELIPIIAIGLSVWQLCAQIIGSSASLFTDSAQYIKAANFPPLFYAFRMTYTCLLFSFHHFAALGIVLLVYPIPIPTTGIVISIASLVAAAINGFFLSIWLGSLCTRYRDVKNIVLSLLQIGFVLTPVIWSPSLIPTRVWLVHLNPIAWFIELFRAPLLHESIDPIAPLGIALLTIVNVCIAIGFYEVIRNRLALWV